MLVLSRKLNEEIVIAGNIRVKVLEIHGSTIRLGIKAPGHVPVLRRELQIGNRRSPSNGLARRDAYQAEAMN